MVINGYFFMGVFLPLCLAVYYIIPVTLFRECVLLLASLVFYSMGSPRYILFFMTAIAVTVGLGRSMNLLPAKQKGRTVLLVIGIALNLGILLYYKYTDFAILTFNRVTGSNIKLLSFALPLGISFYTFKAISYLADICNGKEKPEGTVVHDALYLSFFPQIQSGPLIRYGSFKNAVAVWKNPLFADGVYRFVCGFNKKILLSNVLIKIVDEVYLAFETEGAAFSASYAWLGAIVYSLQLYFDFSGYTDMAVGLSEMFGYPCMENFDYPYMTPSVTKFWRRWHISLSEWFRDYVYFPLGGSRTDKRWKIYRNLLAVWLLTGIWHGASWNFIVWGLGFFAAISFERMTGLPGKIKSRAGRLAYRIPVLLFINFEWVLFRSNGLKNAVRYMIGMFRIHGSELADLRTMFLIRENFAFLIAAILLCFPIIPAMDRKLSRHKSLHLIFQLLIAAAASGLFFLGVSYIVAGQNNPFAYANF